MKPTNKPALKADDVAVKKNARTKPFLRSLYQMADSPKFAKNIAATTCGNAENIGAIVYEC